MCACEWGFLGSGDALVSRSGGPALCPRGGGGLRELRALSSTVNPGSRWRGA